MNPPTLNREQVREVDRRAWQEFGVSGLVLMENAGRGVAEMLLAIDASGPVVICCGKGNNGGDGFVIARRLDLRRMNVRVLLAGEPAELSPDAKVNYEIVRRSGIPITAIGRQPDPAWLSEQLASAAWIVDALLGTGATGEVCPPIATMIDAINASGRRVLAVDVPSGFDCDTGYAAQSTVRAAFTATLVARKPGFLLPGAERFTGEVRVVDIGAPRVLIDSMLAQA